MDAPLPGAADLDRGALDLGLSARDTAGHTDRRLDQAVWAFVVLGLLLRLVRYGLDFPLWGDEAFVAVNFIDRGFRDLLRPLEYGQICPLLFLWIELAAVKCLGFHELSLRLFPLACALASVPLFGHVAGRLFRGWPRLLAVAIFAVSFHPLRHAAEVKPYASDLLVALVLLAFALEWWRRPSQARWLWALAVFVPMALLLSHPAVFAAGGIALGLTVPVWRAGDRSARAGFLAYLLTLGCGFLVLFTVFTEAQGRGALRGLQNYWAHSFPPRDGVGRIAGWFLSVNTGSMFAYPWGGARGTSAATTVCFLAGAAILWRRNRRDVLAMLLGPFLLTLAAAALRRYPYGGEARQMQFVAPAICLLSGLGAWAVVRAFPWPRAQPRLAVAGVAALAIGALVMAMRDAAHPYRFRYDEQAREFARRFWPTQERDAELACLNWDFRIKGRSLNLRTAIYLCNQRIYSPQRRRGDGPDWNAVTDSHPLRCVEYHDIPPDLPEVGAWLRGMQTRYDLRRVEPMVLDASGVKAGPRVERLYVYEFIPKRPKPNNTGAATTAGRQPSPLVR